MVKAEGTVRIIDKDGNVKANLRVSTIDEEKEEEKDATS